MEILLFMVCLNLAVTVIFTLGNAGAIPGIIYIYQTNTVLTGQQLEQTFNGTSVANNWAGGQTAANPFNIYGTLNVLGMVTTFFGTIRLLIDGFPALLDWFGTTFLASSPDGMAAWRVITWALRGLEGLMIFLFAVEFISGRNTTD
jgi:hypothetical protein